MVCARTGRANKRATKGTRTYPKNPFALLCGLRGLIPTAEDAKKRREYLTMDRPLDSFVIVRKEKHVCIFERFISHPKENPADEDSTQHPKQVSDQSGRNCMASILDLH